MQALYQAWRDRALGFVEIMGDGRQIQYGAGGTIAWWRVVARGREGHTAEPGLHVNRAIARAVTEIFALPHPERHRDRETHINVGVIQSGERFNRKPATGWFSLDVRSNDRRIVENIRREIEAILERVSAETRVALDMVPELQTWGGQIPGARDSLLTRAAVAVSRHLGYDPELTDLGCCNMRVAIEGGTLAIGLHGDRGGGRGTPDEWADVPAMLDMARHVVLLAAAVGGVR
jgi:acetylornithine deacetylase/succinyl-diaminopimelate desuccinylase-like protein